MVLVLEVVYYGFNKANYFRIGYVGFLFFRRFVFYIRVSDLFVNLLV